MALRKTDGYRVVYSSDTGRMCPDCNQQMDRCTCSKGRASEGAADGILRVRREVQGRKGKAVTAVRGVAGDAAALKRVLKALKQLCGSGGTVKDGVLEVQGDHCDKVVAYLERQGHKVRRAGG